MVNSVSLEHFYRLANGVSPSLSLHFGLSQASKRCRTRTSSLAPTFLLALLPPGRLLRTVRPELRHHAVVEHFHSLACWQTLAICPSMIISSYCHRDFQLSRLLANSYVPDSAIVLCLSLWVFRMSADSCDPPVQDLAIVVSSSLLADSCYLPAHDLAIMLQSWYRRACWQTPATCPLMISPSCCRRAFRLFRVLPSCCRRAFRLFRVLTDSCYVPAHDFAIILPSSLSTVPRLGRLL
jgi:hypothetical protein